MRSPCNPMTYLPSTLCPTKNNCDSLATKLLKLAINLEGHRIDAAKLGQEDLNPQIPGFDSVRQDRDGSGTRQHRVGGLMVNIGHGAQYNVPSCAATNQMELQKVIIHLARRHQFITTNFYLPPHRSVYSPNHQNYQSWLDHLQKEYGLVCGDFNTHHSSWDDYVSTNLEARRFTTGWKHIQRLC